MAIEIVADIDKAGKALDRQINIFNTNSQPIDIRKVTGVTLTLLFTLIMIVLSKTTAFRPFLQQTIQSRAFYQSASLSSSSTTSTTINSDTIPIHQKKGRKGRILVLGGTGYLGQVVCQKAIQEGYSVVTLSRRGSPTTTPSSSSSSSSTKTNNNNNNFIDYRKGDARQKESIVKIIQEGDICGVVHCIGLLLDTASGLGNYNVYVSGSNSLPDTDSTYDTITRQTAFHAIEAIIEYYNEQESQLQQASNSSTTTLDAFPIPFCFTSAAEAGWPDVLGGKQIESIMPEFIKRYMIAKRAVENKLLTLSPSNIIRPIIVRPSLIYTPEQLASLPAVVSFTLLNKIGLPFVDRPVTVDALAAAIVKSITDTSVRGIQRYPQIDALSGTSTYASYAKT